eukprot:TRINITY_DN16568_c0_g1_i2.p1 TRINITY_DN16568_c0_g1~~TRINITY_DN16568_c0_g1_i2.p1  ORF type:complete len:145 (-),score=57.89 TRINITY_DN16568_c0_g1_i2:7-441(-)
MNHYDMSLGRYFFFFFFQAEDGIRDVERSRGLGDVYKRQVHGDHSLFKPIHLLQTDSQMYILYNRKAAKNFSEDKELSKLFGRKDEGSALEEEKKSQLTSVSYTHLTLPTILLVQISVVAVSLKKKKKNQHKIQKKIKQKIKDK